jgi:hypothetical protein
MPIDIVMSKSGRYKDALPLPIGPTHRSPSQGPSPNTPHGDNCVETPVERGGSAGESGLGSDFVGRPTHGNLPPQAADQNISSNIDQRRPVSPPQWPTSTEIEHALIELGEWTELRVEVEALQQQARHVTTVLGFLRRQNVWLSSQATSFQSRHTQHTADLDECITTIIFDQLLRAQQPYPGPEVALFLED